MVDQVKDPGELGEDELSKANQDGPKEGETEPKAGEEKPDEKKIEKPPEGGEPPAKKEGEEEPDKRTPEQKAEDERKEQARLGYDRRQQQKKDRQADKDRIRQLELDNLKLKAKSFEKLDAVQLNELKTVDPDAWHAYLEKEKEVAGVEAQITEAEKNQQTEAALNAQLDFRDDVYFFAAQAAGVVLQDIPDKFEDLPEKVRTYMNTPEFKAVAAAVDEIFKPQIDRGIYPTARQIRLVAADINRGKTIAQAADNLAQNIKRAGENTSPLNGQPPSGADKTQRDWSKLTVVELDGLSEAEMVEYQKWVNGRRGTGS